MANTANSMTSGCREYVVHHDGEWARSMMVTRWRRSRAALAMITSPIVQSTPPNRRRLRSEGGLVIHDAQRDTPGRVPSR